MEHNKNTYQYFDNDERPIVDYTLGLFNLFKQTGQTYLTDFLSPREAIIFHQIIGNQAQIFEYGGYPNAERKRILLCDWETKFDIDNFKIALLEISYNKKWNLITHSQVLGVLTNIGLEISTFGDIISNEQNDFQFFVKLDLVDFFCQNIKKVGHSSVTVNSVSLKEVLDISDDSIELKKISASLRIDAVVAATTNYSRKKVTEKISQGEIKLNWQTVRKANLNINLHDILSIRHFGRVEIIDINKTKKNKYLLILKVFKTKKR